MLILGNNNIGATPVVLTTVGGSCIAMGPFTCPLTGTIDIFQLYGNNQGNAGNFMGGLYADNAGSPGAHQGHSVIGNMGAAIGWYGTVPASPISVTAGHLYWVAFEIELTTLLYYNPGPPNAKYNDNGYGVWTDPFTVTGSILLPYQYSFFADILPSTLPPVTAGHQLGLIDDGIGSIL